MKERIYLETFWRCTFGMDTWNLGEPPSIVFFELLHKILSLSSFIINPVHLFISFRFDCGSGSGMVRSATPVLLQQWNRASIVRRRWDGWMQLNDGPFTQGRSKVGNFLSFEITHPQFVSQMNHFHSCRLIKVRNTF